MTRSVKIFRSAFKSTEVSFFCPREPATGPRPWIWYAQTFVQPGGGLPDASHSWMFEQWLNSGFAIGGVDVGESYGNPAGRAAFTDFIVPS